MTAAPSPRPSPFALARGGKALLRLPRSLFLAGAAHGLGRALFRLCLGRWPTPAEARLFSDGLRNRAVPLPPCCRAMLNVPAARVQISRLLLTDMVRRGALAANDPFAMGGALPPHSGNPLSFWQGPPVAFLHLEKTAGVSLAKLLTELFHPHQIDPDPKRTIAPHVAAPFAGRPADAIRRRALIFGHYDLPSLQRLDPDRTVITMLREPAHRILSLYYYWRSIDVRGLPSSAALAAVHLAQRRPLLDFLESDDPGIRDHIDNVYVRRLTGLYGTGARADRVSAAPEAALAAALHGLRQIDFVGITEEMAPSVAALGAFLGFTPPADIPHENATADNPASVRVFQAVQHEQLTAAHWRQLGRLTRLDSVVYRVGCERLAQHQGLAPARFRDRFASGYPGAA